MFSPTEIVSCARKVVLMENKSEGVSQVLVHKIEEMSISNTDMSTEDGEDAKEKTRLICQVLELQNTLDDLSVRVDKVKEENLKLKSENQVLGQYIENLMSASSVFQSTSPKNKKKAGGGKTKKTEK